MADALEIVAKFVADTGDLEAGAAKAKGAIGGIGDAFGAIPIPIVAGVGIAVGAITAMTTAAALDRDEQTKLETAYKNSGAAVGDYTGAIDDAIQAGADKAFSDSEVRGGLTDLITATGDAQTANDLMTKSMDIARAANVDLETATSAVAKAYAGNDTQLAKLFPGMAKQATAADTITTATKLSEGAANDYANSTEGMAKKGTDAFGEITEKVGSAFLPIMDKLLPAISPMIDALVKLLDVVLPPLIVAVKLLVDAFTLVVDVVVKVVQWISTVIGWISNKLQPVITKITEVINGIADAFKGVITWIQNTIQAIGDFIGKIGELIGKLNPLKDFKLPSISLPFSVAAPDGATAGTRSTRSARSAGSVTNVTINTSADPEAVVRALRRWAGNNGGAGTFLRGLDRAAS
jgi:hypothetical protein